MLYFYGDDIPDAENTQGWWWETSKKGRERPIKKSQKISFFYKAKELKHACSVCF
ncbi:hypothetical protein MTR_1g099545 [Medicago truncatula]|uniref:Uncharacterized protein n=1 Tax=Medicago truncatula TaxID=3880 RepID=A0A072VNR8_MEDTR|nr:hypothetical protein MTR_1g099545 [Medicago truncatula]